MAELDLVTDEGGQTPAAYGLSSLVSTPRVDLDKDRENTRGDLARGLLWLLTLTIGGVLIFVGLGRLDGTVITQSIFPSLIALAGTALGFYFGSQVGKNQESSPPPSPPPSDGAKPGQGAA